MLLAEVSGSLSAVGYGLPPSVPASVSASSSRRTSSRRRASESARITQQWVWIGFAVVEALALFGIAFGFVFT
jgi:F-type H+-transporting ATPase subunit c